MRKFSLLLLAIATVWLLFPTPCTAQASYPYNYETTCPIGSPIVSPEGTTYDPLTQHFRAGMCLGPDGTLYFNGALINLGTQASNYGAVNHVINALDYGVVPDGETVCDAVVTNASHTVTSATAHFNAYAKNGQTVFATSGQPGCLQDSVASIASVLVLPAGTLTIVNDTTITVTTAGNASASGIANSVLTWGTNNNTALLATYSAAQTSLSCLDIDLPSGMMLATMTSGLFNTSLATCHNSLTHNLYGNLTIRGHGRVSTLIVPTPASSLTCPGSGAYFGGVTGLTFQDWGISGQGWNNTGTNVCSLVGVLSDDFLINFSASWFGAADISMVGILNNQYVYGSIFTGVGHWTCITNNNSIAQLALSFCGDSKQKDLRVDAGSVLHSDRNGYGSVGASGDGGIDIAGTFYSVNDTSSSLVCNCAAIDVKNGGTAYLTHFFGENTGNAVGSTELAVENGGVAYSLDGHYKGAYGTGASGYAIYVAATGKFFDLGGNTVLGTAGHVISGTGFFNSASITGVTQTAANIVLTSGWDTTPAASSVSGDSHWETFTLAPAGTPGLDPVFTITWPTSFWVAPSSCRAVQIGGTQPMTDIATGTVTATTGAFTYLGTPTAGNTIIISVTCP